MKTLFYSFLVVVFFFLFKQDAIAQAPTITSFSPTAGPIGTTVTIIGTHFSLSGSNNIVYFGAVQANVIGASADTLIVTVPAGATYQPIRVTERLTRLVAYSSIPFDVTFANSDSTFFPSSFAAPLNYIRGTNIGRFASADLNADGKPDMVSIDFPDPIYFYNQYLSVSTNNGNGSFANKENYYVYNPGNSFGGMPPYPSILNPILNLNDMDGDGQPDIIAPFEIAGNEMRAPGASFVVVSSSMIYSSDISISGKPELVTGDFDKDGKTDIVAMYDPFSGSVGQGYQQFVSKIRNTTINYALSFNETIDTLYNNYSYALATGDFNSDHKLDIVLVSNDSIFILKDTSSKGKISFARISVLPSNLNYSFSAIAVGDFDGDGLSDFAYIKYDSLTVCLNTSNLSTISFAPGKSFFTGSSSVGIAVGDLDGDGKPDIAVLNTDSNLVSLFKNTSTQGNIEFNKKVDFPAGKDPTGIIMGDWDTDGKSDIAVITDSGKNISILRNQIGEPIPVHFCPPQDVQALRSTINGSSYQWQFKMDSVFTNIDTGIHYPYTFYGADSSVLLVNATSPWYGFQFRCLVDGKYSDVYTIKFVETWTGAVDSAWENPANWSCGITPDFNTDVIINSGTVILSSNQNIRSLSMSPNASLTVKPPYNLTVTH